MPAACVWLPGQRMREFAFGRRPQRTVSVARIDILPGTNRMGIAEKSVVTFRIFADDLVPSEITALLGCEPTKAYSKGDVRAKSKTGYIEKTGSWRLRAEDRAPEDIAAQISEILGRMSADPAVWNQLRSKCEMDFFCGVFMGSGNDGLSFPPELLAELSMRGIALNLDIYDHRPD